MTNPFDLSGKVAIVTGANTGIGQGIALALAAAGADIAAVGRTPAEETVEKVRALGRRAEIVSADLSTIAPVDRVVDETVDKLGGLDILVNNAGIMIENPAQAPSEQSLDTWKRTFDTNVYALVAVTQAFLPLVKQAKSGRIVNVSSMLGSQTLHADPSSGIYDFKIPAYNASKAAVNSWTLSLAYELRNTPIKVNTVHPGYVKTDMNGGNGEIEIAEGARSSVQMALIGESGASGSFTYLGEVLPW